MCIVSVYFCVLFHVTQKCIIYLEFFAQNFFNCLFYSTISKSPLFVGFFICGQNYFTVMGGVANYAQLLSSLSRLTFDFSHLWLLARGGWWQLLWDRCRREVLGLCRVNICFRSYREDHRLIKKKAFQLLFSKLKKKNPYTGDSNSIRVCR